MYREWSPATSPTLAIGRVTAGQTVAVRTQHLAGIVTPDETGILPHLLYRPTQGHLASTCGSISENSTLDDADDIFRIDLSSPFYAPYDGSIELTGGLPTPDALFRFSLRVSETILAPLLAPTFTVVDLLSTAKLRIPRGAHSLLVVESTTLTFEALGSSWGQTFDPYHHWPLGAWSQGFVYPRNRPTTISFRLQLL